MAFTYVARLAAGNRLTVGELAAAPEHAAGAPDNLSRNFVNYDDLSNNYASYGAR